VTPIWYPPILSYHRVHPKPASDTPTVTPEVFDRQMQILASRWRPIPLTTLVDWLEGKGPLPRRAVVVTFDDGEENLFTHAFPILKRHRIPATLFMIASHVGLENSLSADQIDRMRHEGITIGSHGLTHDYLPSFPLMRVLNDLKESRRLLERPGFPVEFLSYAGGGFTPEIAAAAREAGFRAACTTNRGLRRFPIDRWALRRITMHRNVTSPLGIWLRCFGYSGLNRRLRPPT